MVLLKPLSYSCYESVLQHMAADSRILLSLHCPAIKTTEKELTLNIANLILNPLEIQINNTLFEIDFIRKNHVKNTSELMSIAIDKIRNPPCPHKARIAESVTKRKLEILEMDTERPELLQNALARLLEERTRDGKICPLEYTDYLKFSVGQKVQYLEVNKSSIAAIEYLLQKIFAGRNLIHVDKMSIGGLSEAKTQRKFGDKYIPSTFSYLEKFNFKTNKLTSHAGDFDLWEKNGTLEKVKNMEITGDLFLPGFSNMIIEIVPEIGDRWTLDFKEDRNAHAVKNFFATYNTESTPSMNIVEKRENLETIGTDFPTRIVVRLNNISEMHIYCERTEGGAAWRIVFEVLPVEN